MAGDVISGPFGGLSSTPSGPSVEELAAFPRNDDGNAMRFIRMAGGEIGDDGDIDLSGARVLYLRRRGWIVFNGKFWDLETGEARARRHAVQVARAMPEQMKHVVETQGSTWSVKTISGVYEFGNSTGNASKLNNMMAVAASYMDVDVADFDRDPYALNCRNGVVRFRRDADGAPSAKFTAGHKPSDRFTRMANATYDPTAAAPIFERVVNFAQPVEEDRDYLHRVFGYCSTGSTSEQKFFIFQGKGGDSKSTVVNACRYVLGTYATTVAIETFLDTGVKRGSEASPDIAALAGDSRFLSAGEPPSGSKLATGAIKQFTGGGKIKARELREGLFEFSPIGKPVIECNRRPQINDTDNGIWRRLKIVPWRIQVAEKDIDGDLPQKLEKEADGILGWLVEGVLAWMREGLKDVASVAEALEDYRKGSNPFVQWMEDRIVRDAEARVEASELYRDYKEWMEAEGHDKPMSQKSFGGALGDLQITLSSKNAAGRSTRKGARLKTVADGYQPRAPDPGRGAGGDVAFAPDDAVPWDGDQ